MSLLHLPLTNRSHRAASPRNSVHTMRPAGSSSAWQMPGRTPAPMYRHAMPSGPWPWMDFNIDLKPGQPSKETGLSLDKSWKDYPQSIFPNWTPDQVARSGMLTQCPPSVCCSIYNVDVKDDGSFVVGKAESFEVSSNNGDEIWKSFQVERPEGIRVRALFVDKMTVPILRMLGAKYTIEPFFFSSSTNWIPSRYQEEVKPGEGDHITITLPFVRAVQCPPSQSSAASATTGTYPPDSTKTSPSQRGSIDTHQIIDTQSPLFLRSSRHILMLDLFSIHMVRSAQSSTIISYHPDSDSHRTGAERMNGLLYSIGQSVYWQKIFSKTSDPTFVLLSMLWYALYAWDESFEILYAHINILESSVITTNEMHLTRELHIIQAHLLFYATLLQDFIKSVMFVLETPHPATESILHDDKKRQERQDSKELLKKECSNLLSAIERLEGIRDMHSKRLQNVMNLAFATVNIDDSKQMKELTQAALRDSTAMKQISYLTMIFLPASFTGTVFGMNVKEINSGSYETLSHYVITTLLLTLTTVWIVVALQSTSHFHGPGPDKGLWIRLCWPVRVSMRKWREYQASRTNKKEYRDKKQDLDLEKGSITDE